MIKYKTLKAPISIQLELTEECNNNCLHCYNHWRVQDTPRNTLNKENLNKIIDQLIISEVMSVTITGGEPLIYKDLVLDAIHSLRKAHINLSLNSNLTLLSYKYATELKECGLYSILTSLLSCKDEVHDKITCNAGSFKNTVRGIQKVMGTGPNFHNFHQLAEHVTKQQRAIV